jgi:hypothetical protein
VLHNLHSAPDSEDSLRNTSLRKGDNHQQNTVVLTCHPLAHPNTNHFFLTYPPATFMWAFKLSLLHFKQTHSYPVTLRSNWLKLFLSQTLSHLDTTTILKFLSLFNFLPMKMLTDRVFRNVGI